MKTSVYLLALASFCAVSHGHGQGTLIAGHFGDADPTTEGFTLLRSGNPSLAPVVDDLGVKAWSIGLDTGADIGQYSQLLGDREQTALGSGWILSLTLRIVEPFGTPTFGIFAGVNAAFRFGAQSDGDPILRVGNSEYTLEGAGPGYHNYQLRYDPGLGVGSLWTDGTLLTTDIAVWPGAPTELAWGGAQHPPGSACAHWNEVSLRAIPEPSTPALLVIGGALLVAVRRRRTGAKPASRQ